MSCFFTPPPPLYEHCPGNVQTHLGHGGPEASVSRYFTSRARTWSWIQTRYQQSTRAMSSGPIGSITHVSNSGQSDCVVSPSAVLTSVCLCGSCECLLCRCSISTGFLTHCLHFTHLTGLQQQSQVCLDGCPETGQAKAYRASYKLEKHVSQMTDVPTAGENQAWCRPAAPHSDAAIRSPCANCSLHSVTAVRSKVKPNDLHATATPRCEGKDQTTTRPPRGGCAEPRL